MTNDQRKWVGVGAGVLTVICAALPWATVRTIFGSISASGLDGGDGVFTAALGICGALCVAHGKRAALIIALLCGIAISLIGVYDYDNASEIVDETNAEGGVIASVGIGLYGTIVAGVALLAMAGLQLQALAQQQPTTASGLPPGSPLPPPSV